MKNWFRGFRSGGFVRAVDAGPRSGEVAARLSSGERQVVDNVSDERFEKAVGWARSLAEAYRRDADENNGPAQPGILRRNAEDIEILIARATRK